MKTLINKLTIAALFAAGVLAVGFGEGPAIAQDAAAPTSAPQPAPAAPIPPDLAAIAAATNTASAQSAFAQALADRGQVAPVYDVYINRMLSLGAIELLRQPAQALVQLNPASGLAWALTGFFKAQDGTMNEAVADTVRATELSPSDPYVLQLAGQLVAWYDFQGDRAALGADIQQGMVQLDRFKDKAPFIDGYNAATAALREQSAATASAVPTPYTPDVVMAPSVIYDTYPVYLNPYPTYYSYYPYGFYYPQLFAFFSFGREHHRRYGRWGAERGEGWRHWGGHRGLSSSETAAALAAPTLTGEQVLRNTDARRRWNSRTLAGARTAGAAATLAAQPQTTVTSGAVSAARGGVNAGAVSSTGVRTQRRFAQGSTLAGRSAAVGQTGGTTVNRSAVRERSGGSTVLLSPSAPTGTAAPRRSVQSPRGNFGGRTLSTPFSAPTIRQRSTVQGRTFSTPRFSAGATPLRSFSASTPSPSRSFAAPSRSFSAPSRSLAAPRSSPRFSAPSRSSAAPRGGGGGRHR
ncbi:MAG: hypothetical protein LLG01_14605 [Planctomycetaceae bacterium]|nr:hypothetical protein [Planctomycetaceae bacterium]